MKYIREQYDDFRNNTPAYAQWLLLGAAFLIVIILLTLVLSHRSDNSKKVKEANKPITFNVNPTGIRFDNVKVGESESAKVSVSVSEPVIIDSVKISDKSVTVKNNTCVVFDTIEDCTINIVYTPTMAQSQTKTSLVITWFVESAEDVVKTEEIPVVFSSYEEPKKVETPKPAPKPEPEPEPEPYIEPEIPDPVKDIEPIIRPNPFRDAEPEPEPEPEPVLPPKQCSEFAIPGYDASGNQIGWIKPERGTNYFYPFSDKTCSNPTGKYDMATGIIYSLKDGSWMGTDSDHVGYKYVRNRNLKMPQLSAPTRTSASGGEDKAAVWQAKGAGGQNISTGHDNSRKFDRTKKPASEEALLKGSAGKGESVTSSRPYDRTFILRQFKPIPATIVSEVRADPSVYGYDKSGNKLKNGVNHSIPVRATVDRNVYSDDGRTIILPTGTLLMGYLSGNLPGPYQAFGRMNIRWYQFIRPDGVEFNFENKNQDPYSADAQGRMGVPGHGSTDYIEQMVMPLLTAMVPAAVNMIAPIADTVINQIDLDNNTIVQSGTIRSSEMAKQDIINTWNKITQKLLVDAIDNTVPPFSIAAGTRINVFSPVDLIVSCEGTGKKCSAITAGSEQRRKWADLQNEATFNPDDPSWVGQVRSFDLMQYCAQKNNKWTIADGNSWAASGYEYRTVLAYCESLNYAAINNAKQSAYNESTKQKAAQKYGDAEYDHTTNTLSQSGSDEQQKAYSTEVLGLQYDDEGYVKNPFEKTPQPAEPEVLTCDDGNAPDSNGCCPGETFTDMGEDGWNCCPDAGGDCFPPIILE
jgi:type IV secretory pathway VirB10-like protein